MRRLKRLPRTIKLVDQSFGGPCVGAKGIVRAAGVRGLSSIKAFFGKVESGFSALMDPRDEVSSGWKVLQSGKEGGIDCVGFPTLATAPIFGKGGATAAWI